MTKKRIPESMDIGAKSFVRPPFFVALLLAFFTLLIYLPLRNCGFTNYDDQDYVTSNTHVKAGLSWAGIKWAFTSGDASNWHPLTWISHMLDMQLFGLDPAAHHWTNILLHTAATVLLFLFLYRTTRAVGLSAMVAALFGWHPMHVESVAWIAERKDVLSGFFAMLTLCLYAIYAEQRQSTSPRSKYTYVFVLFSFGLGLMAKPMLVTLPFVLLLLDFWPLRRFGNNLPESRLILEKIPLLLLSLASSVITFIVQHSAGSVRTLEIVPLDSRIFNSLIAYWLYVKKLVWPSNLAVFYPMSDWVSGWLGLIAGFFLLSLSILLFLRRKKTPALFVGWFWFLGMLVPVIGIVQVGAQSMADRYTYLPSIGIFIGVVWMFQEWTKKILSKPAMVAVGVAALAACAVGTEMQIPHWKSTVTLFQHALAVTQDNYVAHINLGSALMQQNAPEEALSHFEQALALKADMFEAHYGAGVILEKQGKLQLAMEHFRAAVELRPGHAVAHNNLGTVLLSLDRKEEAVHEFRNAIDADPAYAEPHYNLGLTLTSSNIDQAIGHYQDAVRLRPDYADARNNLAVALAGQGKYQSAAENLREVVKLRSDDAEAHFNLSFVLSKLGRTNEAKDHFDTAFRLNPNLVSRKK